MWLTSLHNAKLFFGKENVQKPKKQLKVPNDFWNKNRLRNSFMFSHSVFLNLYKQLDISVYVSTALEIHKYN